MSSIARQITAWQKKEIGAALKRSRRIISHETLDIRVQPKQQNIGRILVIISTKDANAVHRNRLRRQIKALFYQQQYYLLGYDWIIFAKKESTGMSFEELAMLLQKAASAL